MKMTVKTLKKQLTMRKICEHGVCQKKVKMNEQWQEAISRRDKQKVKKSYQASLLSVEHSHNLNPKKVIEVKDRCPKVRVTTDAGAAGHVVLEAMFHVKLERKTS